jgi:Na+-translocating ferredoxin:NAD+ oxidoreductase RnfA subunit
VGSDWRASSGHHRPNVLIVEGRGIHNSLQVMTKLTSSLCVSKSIVFLLVTASSVCSHYLGRYLVLYVSDWYSSLCVVVAVVP